MPRRKSSYSQLAIVDRNGEADEPIAKKDRSLDFGGRWNYAPALEATNYIKLRDRYQLFINGRFVAPKSGEYFDSINPATEEKLTEIGSANEKDVDLAVKAARRAYKTVWSKMPGRERGKYLFRIARLIQEKAWKLAPALACGNTCVLKPAETTSITALHLAEIFQEAGLPDGVVNIVTGAGETGGAIVNHSDIDKIAFTGSTEVGKRIASATAGTKKKLTLELGGKAANIIFDDAPIDQAVEGIIAGIY